MADKISVMKENIEKLKKKYTLADSDEEREKINQTLNDLAEKYPNEFVDSMVSSIEETARKSKELLLRVKLKEVLPAVSVSYIAKEYFNQTKSWLQQRINGDIVNGEKVSFTEKELSIFETALKDIAEKLSQVQLSF